MGYLTYLGSPTPCKQALRNLTPAPWGCKIACKHILGPVYMEVKTGLTTENRCKAHNFKFQLKEKRDKCDFISHVKKKVG